MMTNKRMQIGVLLFTALVLSAVFATSASAGGHWGSEGKSITEGEGALNTETTAEFQLADTKTAAGEAKVSCSAILDGTVSAKGKDEVTEVLNVVKEKVGANLVGVALLCTRVSVCEAGTDIEVWPDNLPWLTELASVGGEGGEGEGAPLKLDKFKGTGEGHEPGWEVLCLFLAVSLEDLCEGPTSGTVENIEGHVLVKFSPTAPINSEKLKCTQGGAEAGTLSGQGTTSLVNGKALTAFFCIKQLLFGEYKNEPECEKEENPGMFLFGWNNYS